jgi:hypothetical protein
VTLRKLLIKGAGTIYDEINVENAALRILGSH